jgi:hypothetical protein
MKGFVYQQKALIWDAFLCRTLDATTHVNENSKEIMCATWGHFDHFENVVWIQIPINFAYSRIFLLFLFNIPVMLNSYPRESGLCVDDICDLEWSGNKTLKLRRDINYLVCVCVCVC